MKYLTLCTNIVNSSITQYRNYNFNSICKVGDHYVGANESGLFILDRCASDNGTDIDARVRTSTNDFQDSRQKRIRSVYINGKSDGDLVLIVRNDQDNEREYTISMSDLLQKGYKVPIGRDGKGRNWDFEIQNVDGCDFSIDSIEIMPIILNRKPPY